MKTEKELLKEKIDKKYEFYEKMVMNGIAEPLAVKLEKELKDLMDNYNSIE